MFAICQVSHFKEYIPKAFPHGKDLILDAEVLMMDTKTGNPLPFGTLGVHKVSSVFSIVLQKMLKVLLFLIIIFVKNFKLIQDLLFRNLSFKMQLSVFLSLTAYITMEKI